MNEEMLAKLQKARTVEEIDHRYLEGVRQESDGGEGSGAAR